MAKTHDFGEKKTEKVDGQDLQVWQTPKYKASKEKAIELIDKGEYGLADADFWILKNKTKTGKMAYTGLIISHDGCLKINEKLPAEKKYKAECIDENQNGYKDSLVIRYVCPEQGLYEYGEVNSKNCKNDYPYAMALKRLLDRVILKNSGVAMYGIYSEAESEDFKQNPEPPKQFEPESRKPYGARWKEFLERRGVNMSSKENWYANLPDGLQKKAQAEGYKAFTEADWKQAFDFVVKEDAEAGLEAAMAEELNY